MNADTKTLLLAVGVSRPPDQADPDTKQPPPQPAPPTQAPPLRCRLCPFTATDESFLEAHLRGHPSHAKPYACPACGKAFALPAHLRNHQRTHTGERPHGCPDCGKAFARTGGLQRHRATHTGERPHPCPECGKAFARRAHLRNHRMVHAGARPHGCADCGKAFAWLGALQRHRRTHTGERPYVCTVCERAFAQSDHLRSHQRTHTGERPHACGECGRAFSLPGALQRHRRIHRGGGKAAGRPAEEEEGKVDAEAGGVDASPVVRPAFAAPPAPVTPPPVSPQPPLEYKLLRRIKTEPRDEEFDAKDQRALPDKPKIHMPANNIYADPDEELYEDPENGYQERDRSNVNGAPVRAHGSNPRQSDGQPSDAPLKTKENAKKAPGLYPTSQTTEYLYINAN